MLKSGRDGIRAVNRANPAISNSVLAGNTGFGVQNLDTTLVVNARNNFWGDPSGPLDTSNVDGRGQTNPNGKGDKVSEYVDWGGFLQANINESTFVKPAADVGFAPEFPCSDSALNALCFAFTQRPVTRTITVDPDFTGVSVQISVGKSGSSDDTRSACWVIWEYVRQP